MRTPYLGEELGEIVNRGAEPLAQRAHVLFGQVVADRFEEWEVRERELGLAANAGHHDATAAAGTGDEVGDQPGLAHSRLAADDHDAPVASEGGQQRILEDRDLGLAADQVFAEDSSKGHV